MTYPCSISISEAFDEPLFRLTTLVERAAGVHWTRHEGYDRLKFYRVCRDGTNLALLTSSDRQELSQDQPERSLSSPIPEVVLQRYLPLADNAPPPVIAEVYHVLRDAIADTAATPFSIVARVAEEAHQCRLLDWKNWPESAFRHLIEPFGDVFPAGLPTDGDYWTALRWRVNVHGAWLEVTVPFELKDEFRAAVPGRCLFDGKRKSWNVPLSSRSNVLAFAHDHRFAVAPELWQYIP